MPRVVILQRALPHYRVPFFDGLRNWLMTKGVHLDLVYGRPAGAEAQKKDAGTLPWAIAVDNTHYHVGSSELVWQPANQLVAGADLVISEQANRNLINYLLILRRRIGGPRFAYWGHGRNRQDRADSWKNRFKSLLLHQADWWFAYTEGVKQDLIASRYPAEKITALQNSIDTRAFAGQLAQVTDEHLSALRAQLALSGDARVVLYCGGMYQEKEIPFLLKSFRLIQAQIPQAALIAVGSGPEAHLFQEAARNGEGIYYLGPKFRVEKAACYKLAELVLMPGLVGLAVLDSFVAGVPMATTQYPFHSPEIEYIEPGVNGIVSEFTEEAYAQAVISYLDTLEMQSRLKAGCQASAPRFSIENMIENFGEGILNALK